MSVVKTMKSLRSSLMHLDSFSPSSNPAVILSFNFYMYLDIINCLLVAAWREGFFSE